MLAKQCRKSCQQNAAVGIQDRRVQSVEIKNRDYWRYEMERESAISQRRRRVFV
jgi:hypothetical protein